MLLNWIEAFDKNFTRLQQNNIFWPGGELTVWNVLLHRLLFNVIFHVVNVSKFKVETTKEHAVLFIPIADDFRLHAIKNSSYSFIVDLNMKNFCYENVFN